jgi:hypothetical protein
MKTCTRYLVGGVVAALVVPLSVRAAEPARCNDLFDDAQRLACYDAAFGKPVHVGAASGAPAAPVAGVAATATVAATAAAPPASNGGSTSGTAAALPDKFTSSVTAVGKAADGRLIVTLANAQQWLQQEPDTRVEIKVGDTVTLAKMLMGNYGLTTHSGYQLRVKRLL